MRYLVSESAPDSNLNEEELELVNLMRFAVTQSDPLVTDAVKKCFAETCDKGFANRKKVWEALTASERTVFKALLAELEAQPQPEHLPHAPSASSEQETPPPEPIAQSVAPTVPLEPTEPPAPPIVPPESVTEPPAPIALLVEKIKAAKTWAEVESVWNGDPELKNQVKSQLPIAELKRVGKLYKKAESEQAISEIAPEPAPPTEAVDTQSHQLDLLPDFKSLSDSDGRFCQNLKIGFDVRKHEHRPGYS